MNPVAMLLYAAVSVSPVAASAQAPVLTLAQAVEEALANNHQLLNQRDAVERAELSVQLARNAFQPKVVPNMLGSFGQTNVASQTYRVDLTRRFSTGMEVRLGAGTASAQIPGLPGTSTRDIRFYNADTTLGFTQPLLRGFGRGAARRGLTGAEARNADAERQQVLAEHQVAIEVASVYYTVVTQHALVGVARQGLERARRLRDASEAKLDVGLVSQLDVLRAQQLVTQAETDMFDAQAATEDAVDRLAFLMGRSAAQPFEVVRHIPVPDARPLDASVSVATALAHRLELKRGAADIADADSQLRFTRNQLLPQVDVNLALTRRVTSSTLAKSFGLDGYQFATFFTIAAPADRTVQRIEFDNAIIERNRRRRDLATLERQIADDVRAEVREWGRLLRALQAADTSVAIGRREVEVAQLRYDKGLSNNLDVVTAESGLMGADSRRLQAGADIAVAHLRLRAVLGVLAPRTDMTDVSSVQ